MFPDLLPTETSTGVAAPAPRTTTLALFSPSGRAERRFWEFFTVHIRNPNTRLAYPIRGGGAARDWGGAGGDEGTRGRGTSR